ncbi:MAG: glycosyltransferase family 39 protein [Anaerolineales bacterium]|nr:glycosyltransferase family 39 protein [Anaerolineales bacterium]
MRLPFKRLWNPSIATTDAHSVSREQTLGWIGITLIVILAAVLRFANLDAIGYANHYYTAAVTSMLQSWHNFFFVAAEPGGAVSVDKPPLGLWLQAISAYFLGVSGFSVVLPQILAGIFSVIVLYHLVKRSFGTTAGLVAAFALAVTPVVIATDRNNTMDSTLIFTLLLATLAFIKATETRKLKFLLLGATLVGLGFNIKMLEAYLPLPAFYAVYLLGSPEKFWIKVRNLALATILLAVVSFSWAIAVDLTPASQRPYVGSSSNNTEMSLIFGYNGVNRLLGMMGRDGQSNRNTNQGGPTQGQTPNGAFNPPASNGTGNGFTPMRPPQAGNGFPQGNPPQGIPNDGQGRGGPGGGGGGFNIGQAGALRLFSVPLSKETSWLLPFGIISMLVLLLGFRWHWPVESKHQALILWGGWLVTTGIFFSVAGFFHEYYLSMMAAPLAALVGIGVTELWRLRERRFWLAIGLSAAAIAGTLAFQFWTAQSFTNELWWLYVAIAIFGVGLIVLSISMIDRTPSLVMKLGFALLVIAMLVTPTAWSALTNLNTSANQSLPAAYSGGSSGPANRGGTQVNETLLSYLESNTQGMKYLMAVPSSMQGSDYILATGRPVLYLGGFSGQDSVVSTDDLSQMVSNGELRYIYWGGGGGGPNGGNSNISNWVTSTCKAVQGFETTTRNSGAPDGTGTGIDNQNNRQNNSFGPGGNMQVTLYDCG